MLVTNLMPEKTSLVCTQLFSKICETLQICFKVSHLEFGKLIWFSTTVNRSSCGEPLQTFVTCNNFSTQFLVQFFCPFFCQEKIVTVLDILLRPLTNCGEKRKSDLIEAGGDLMENPLRHFILGWSRPPLSCQKARQQLKWFNKTKYNIPKGSSRPAHHLGRDKRKAQKCILQKHKM